MRGKDDASRFPETAWSQLAHVANPDDSQHDQKLNEMASRYWTPAFHYIRAIRRLSVADAEDLTQGFFAAFLSRFDFSQLSPDKGSFRGLLKIALRRFVATVERKNLNRAQLEKDPRFIDEALAISVTDSTPGPDQVFEKKRAEAVLAAAVVAVEKELSDTKRQVYFDVFRDYCLNPTDETSYESVAQRHGVKADDVRNYLRVVRQKLRSAVRRLLRDYLFPGEDLEEEIVRVLSQ